MTYRALFSCWDASDSVETSWIDGAPGYCERFGGEGTGSHCIIPVELQQGVVYEVVVAFAGHVKSGGVSGNAWAGSFVDTSTNTSTPIGTLFHPDFNGYQGYGMMQIAGAHFQEYFLSSDCSGQAHSEIGLVGPFLTPAGTATIVAPSQAVANYAGNCTFDNVGGSAPGFPQHSVLLQAGGTVKRITPANVPLWPN